MNKEMTPRQWLIDAARAFKSEEAAETMSRLLDALDANSIAYDINKLIENRKRSEQETIVSEITGINFDLAINPDSYGNGWLIDVSMPDEALDFFQEVPFIGYVPTFAYQWLINENMPDRVTEGSVEDILCHVRSMSAAQYMAFLRQQEWILSSDLFSDEQKAVTQYKLKCVRDFMELSRSAQHEFLRPLDSKIDFETININKKFELLIDFDKIVRPIIGRHAFPDWTCPGFIDEVVRSVKNATTMPRYMSDMRHYGDISDSLTFDQFKKYAEREPSLRGEWIYKLTHYWMGNEASYPAFGLSTDEYFFRAYDDVERFIKHNLKNIARDWCKSYAFRIDQIPTGEVCHHTGAGWLYDAEGDLIDYTVTTMTGAPYQTCFFGRPAERMRFKKGDIVEVVDGDTVKLAVVADDGPSIEYFWELYQRGSVHHADASDDCYYLIDGPGFSHHIHINSLAMMKPRFPISDDVKEFFNYCLEHADDNDCRERYQVESFYPRHLDTVATIDVRIVYDNEEKRHRLKVEDFRNGEITLYIIDRSIIEHYAWWLDEVQGGKSRLWYIIRDWNENYRDEDNEPYLSPDTPLEDFLK